jgi:ABC-2 type transport system permease protein
MKQFLIVLQFELKEYSKNKSFVISTAVLAILGAVLLFLPRFIDMSSFTGVGKTDEVTESEEKDRDMIYFDHSGYGDVAILNTYFPDVNWKEAKSEAEIEKAVKDQEVDAGFIIKSTQEYDYYVYNSDLSNTDGQVFESVMKLINRTEYSAANGLDIQELNTLFDAPITMNQQILNKDAGNNFAYSYALVIIVFMMIVIYGQMIATFVASEKSNRTIEVLVTTTTTNSLLFGKVIAGAIGGMLQIGITLGATLISYQINYDYWGGSLDMFLAIPPEVLITFAFFGLGGYLFYGFLFGAVGALVSRTEDISKSSGGLMMIIMVVYMFSLMQLTNPDGMAMKILSFIPFTSYSTMFIRLAMGTVSVVEIIISFSLLVIFIIGAGLLGAKLYRMGTLRYGNPIKFTTALKNIKSSD